MEVPTSKGIDYLIRTSSFTKPNIPLILNNDVLTFGKTEVNITDVTGLKYGIESIRFYKFHVGTNYIIDLESKSKQLSIHLNSYFNIQEAYFSDLYSTLIDAIWQDITLRLVNEFSDLLVSRQEFSIGNCRVTPEGIFIKGELTTWQDLSFQRNYDRLTLNNKSNLNVWTNLYYTKTYNVDVLAAILDWALNQNGLSELPTL